MFRFLADENFDNDILRGMLRRTTRANIVRVQDVGLAGAEDPDVLTWAAREQRILLTHDVATLTTYAHKRVASGAPMPGVFEVNQLAPIGMVIDDLLLIVEYSDQADWTDQIVYIPLKS